MPSTPKTYLELQIMFQDRYEASIKAAGLPEWVISSDLIINYIYNSELQLCHELAANKNWEMLSGYITTSTFTGAGLTTGPYTNSKKTAKTNIDYYVRSHSTVTTTHFGTVSSVVENELISVEDAPFYATSNFNVPYFKNPKIYLEPLNVYISTITNDKIIVLLHDFYTTVTSLDVMYVTLPSQTVIGDVTASCYTHWTLYEKLVDIAVNKAIANLVKLNSKPKESE